MRLALALVLLTACTPSWSTVPLAPGSTVEAEIEAGGLDRSFALHLPPESAEPMPLMVVLHGGGGSGRGMEETTGFSRIADREGFAVVYPDGLGGPHGVVRTWNAGWCCGLPHHLGVDDVGYVSRLLEAVAGRVAVDRSRIYLVGYSNGGALAYRIASEMGERFAAMGVYAATMPTYGLLEAPDFVHPPPREPISTILVISETDPYIPYHGRDEWSRAEASQEQIARYYAVAAECRGRARPERADDGGAILHRHRQCAEGTAVERLTLYGWSHDWPSRARVRACHPPDAPLRDFDLAERMWRFFEDKRRSDAWEPSSATPSHVVHAAARRHAARHALDP